MIRPILAVLAASLLCSCAARRQVKHPLPAVSAVHSAAFRQEMSSLLGSGLVPGNRIETLNNGDEIFPAMLAAIRGARRTVDFESFIFATSEPAQAFVDALAERARAGVKVNVVFDAVGAAKGRGYFQTLRDAGVELRIYHTVLWLDPRRYNHRTHRKLLVVDGRIGFTGGVGIAPMWEGDARNPDEWRDVHYRIEGPVVAKLQGAFADNWRKTGGAVLQGPGYFPELRPAGGTHAGVFFSSPRLGRTEVELMYHLAIAAARQSLLIENAYFVPDRSLTGALVGAAQRGVRVQILVPGEHIDQPAVRRASRKRWDKLLEAGVEIYEYQPTMVHTKLLVADGLFVSVGSANLDPRSLRINDEANVNVFDAGFAAEQTRLFRRDLRNSERVREGVRGLETIHETPLGVGQMPLEGQL